MLSFEFIQQSIPSMDLIFGVSYLLYLRLANSICFDSNRLALSQKEDIDSLGRGIFLGNRAFYVYMCSFFIFTVMLPVLLICFGPDEISRPCISPTALLLLQVFGEATTLTHHDACRILLPIGFNAYRLIPLVAWTNEAMTMFELSSSASLLNWYGFACGLSIINTVMWFYNLFGFLLLRVLPVYFDKIDTPPVEMAFLMIPYPKRKSFTSKHE